MLQKSEKRAICDAGKKENNLTKYQNKHKKVMKFNILHSIPPNQASPRELQIPIVCPRALCYNAYVLSIITADNIIHQLTNFTAA